MTLRELVAAHPDRFYPQTWYAGEAFIDTPLPLDAPTTLPSVIIEQFAYLATIVPCRLESLPLAVELAALYVAHPTAELWRRYLWCDDADSAGQRVYMGVNNGRMEIHRHIHLTERFGIPVWT